MQYIQRDYQNIEKFVKNQNVESRELVSTNAKRLKIIENYGAFARNARPNKGYLRYPGPAIHGKNA